MAFLYMLYGYKIRMVRNERCIEILFLLICSLFEMTQRNVAMLKLQLLIQVLILNVY